MTITYRLDEPSRTLFVAGVGEIDADQISATFRSILADPEFETGMKLLIDLTQQKTVTSEPLLRDTAKRLEDPELSFRRIALLGDRDAMFGIARMIEVFAEKAAPEIQSFRRRDDAMTWLALPDFRSPGLSS